MESLKVIFKINFDEWHFDDKNISLFQVLR